MNVLFYPYPPMSLSYTVSLVPGDNINLQWLTWNGALPNGAVSIYNDYTKRTDYVCKYGCTAGFYNPSLGPYCHYTLGKRELRTDEFQILANKDEFEVLEWKKGSYGSVPQDSVSTSPGVYVGKNKYGLGKVEPEHRGFYLPWKGAKYFYKHYEVLTINRDAYSQKIDHVDYNLNGVEVIKDTPETLYFSGVTNNGDEPVVQTVTMSETEEAKTWNIGRSSTMATKISITAKIPEICSGSIGFSNQTMQEFSEGTTIKKAVSHSISVQVSVPPNHSCAVHMEGCKMTANIPYTARLSRTYRNGETRSTYISGMYSGVEIGFVQAVVNRCEPVANTPP